MAERPHRLLQRDQGTNGKSRGDQRIIFFHQILCVRPGTIGALYSFYFIGDG